MKSACRLLCLLLCTITAGSRGATAALTDAQREAIAIDAEAAYERGVARRDADPAGARTDFAEAVGHYRHLLDDGVVSAPLNYNLANAYLQMQDLGRAVLHYRIAIALRPGHTRARENLAYARSLCERRVDAHGAGALRDALLNVPRRFSVALRVAVALFAWTVLWLLVSIRTAGFRRAAPKWVMAAMGVASIAAILAVVSGLTWERARPAGVVLDNEVVVRKGDGMGFDPAFEEPLTAGVEVTVEEDRATWYRISLPDGSEGWLPATAVGVVEVGVY